MVLLRARAAATQVNASVPPHEAAAEVPCSLLQKGQRYVNSAPISEIGF